MSSSSQLSALVSLIADATKTVEVLFQGSLQPFVPSLDDTTPHPFDTGVSSMEMKKAIQIIEGACAQLCAIVAPPNQVLLNTIWFWIVQKAMSIYEPACLHVAVTFKIPDILQEKPAGMHISELAQRTHVEVGKLGRVLRLLATKHCFREVKTNVFANNRLSQQLLSTDPFSSLVLTMADENNKALSLLTETLADPDWGHSYAPEHSAFNKYSKYPKPLFDYYEGDTDEGRRRGARFGVAMMGGAAVIDTEAVVQHFPWRDLDDGASVCDVGGGVGIVSLLLAKAYPALKFKLQDTPERIHQAKTIVWPAECPEAIRENRIEFKAFDFLVESPIKGCDIYFLKNIIHDWPDKECLQILRGVRDSMGPKSRVILHGYILQSANRVPDEESNYTQAPEPLLPNYGAGRMRQYNNDIAMMTLLNSMERSMDEFVWLGSQAGLQFVKFWDLGEMGLMEFRL